MKTVGELIKELDRFPSSMPVFFRAAEGEGYFNDFNVNPPQVFFPGGAVCLSAGEPVFPITEKAATANPIRKAE